MSDDFPTIDKRQRRGRAANSNAEGRFERHQRVAEDDGWDLPEDLPVLRTELTEERPRKVITRNSSPDVPFDRSLNPYRGCEHGCIYCFARPTHAWLNLSPGLDFETRLVVRPGAAEQLARELSAPRYRPAPLALGTNTDPYQPVERDRKIMRGIMEVLRDFNHPVAIVTKGAMIERDLDILTEMAGRGLVQVGISVTTLDPVISRRMEPRAPAPARRLAAIRTLADAGVPVRVMAAPVIPSLTDHELEAILRAAAQAGARSATWIMLRLPLEVAPLFEAWLGEHYPNRKGRILSHLRDMHGGKLYQANWGRRMRGTGPYADLIAARFARSARQYGLHRALPELRSDSFAVPPRVGDQLTLF